MLTTDISDWIFLFLALGIYFDATHHKIGKIRGFGFLNMSAGGWAAAASLTYIGLIAAFLYALKRKGLIEKAKQHPVHLSIAHRIIVTGLLFVLPMCIPYFISYFFSVPDLDASQLEQLMR